MHPAPEHQHAIHVAERRRLVNRHDARAGGRAHMGINREDRHGAENAERQRTQSDSFQPRAHASSSVPALANEMLERIDENRKLIGLCRCLVDGDEKT